MAGLSRWCSAGRMDFGTGYGLCRAVLDTSRFDPSSTARESVSVSMVNLSCGSGAGKSFV